MDNHLLACFSQYFESFFSGFEKSFRSSKCSCPLFLGSCLQPSFSSVGGPGLHAPTLFPPATEAPPPWISASSLPAGSQAVGKWSQLQSQGQESLVKPQDVTHPLMDVIGSPLLWNNCQSPKETPNLCTRCLHLHLPPPWASPSPAYFHQWTQGARGSPPGITCLSCLCL